jgi:hypothetical protein
MDRALVGMMRGTTGKKSWGSDPRVSKEGEIKK